MARPIHFELSTIDPARAITFYKAVFGWKIEPAGGPWEYYLITTGTDPEPGINGAISRSRDGTVGTVNTISVTSVDESVTAVTANGGTVIMTPQPMPGVGMLAMCKDTEGNVFGLLQMEHH
ncbi:MAG: VOC family protein [Candidatus Cryosericum sp.]